MNKIQIRGGKWFDFANPESTPLSVDDVAWGLSHEFRYSNQAFHQLTVAQHSVWTSLLTIVPKEFRLGLLFHDASEAVMKDLASPLKALLPQYRDLEKRVQSAILKALDISPAPIELVNAVDEAALEIEMKMVFDPRADWFEIWSPIKARAEFLKRYSELRANGS
jgi:uncharacterized protein